MLRLPSIILAAATLLFTCAPSLACSSQQAQDILTAVLYREAQPTTSAQAAVAATVFTRLEQGKWGSSLCAVMTARGQYVHKLPPHPEHAKLALARANARAFIAGNGSGHDGKGGDTFERFRQAAYTSFYASYASYKQVPKKYRRKGETVGDNHFYRATR